MACVHINTLTCTIGTRQRDFDMQLTPKIQHKTTSGFTTSEVIISVAILSAFYASILTISSLISSKSRPSEIRPALDQVVTSDIEFIRNQAWAFLYHTKPSNSTSPGVSCYLTDPSCPPNDGKSIDDMRSICSNLNQKFIRYLQLSRPSLSASTHSIFRDNSSLSLSRSLSQNVSLPIPLRSYDRSSIRLDYFLKSTSPEDLSELSDISNIRNNQILLRSYTFTPTAHSFCTGFSIY